MGRYIKIEKIKSVQGMHYYRVLSPDFPEVEPFYIGLDQYNKAVYFFKNNNFDQPDYKIDLDENKKNDKIVINWLPSFLVFGTLVKAKEVFIKGVFGECISFQS